jgi:hypothetical protein
MVTVCPPSVTSCGGETPLTTGARYEREVPTRAALAWPAIVSVARVLRPAPALVTHCTVVCAVSTEQAAENSTPVGP